MTIKFLGHATFLLTSDEGVRIITDPYEPGGFGGQIRYGPITEEADVVTVSHDHADHNYVQGVPGNPAVVTSAGEVSGIDFEVTESYHDDAQGARRGVNGIFCFEVDDLRVCHLGDLGHLLSTDQAASLGHVDVLLIPVGGTFTIDARQATALIEQLHPTVALPMHFETPRVGLPIAPVADFLAGKDNVEVVGGSEVSISAEDLSAPPRIIVLEPTN